MEMEISEKKNILVNNNECKFDSQRYANSIPEKLKDKFTNLINNKEYYSLLLQVKTQIRKIMKVFETSNESDISQAKDSIVALTCFTVIKLSEVKQTEAIVDMMKFFCEEFDKYKIIVLDSTTLLGLFTLIFSSLPKKDYKKQTQQVQALQFMDKHKVKASHIKKSGLYRSFAEDNLLNEDPISGYKFAIASEDPQILELFIDLHLSQTEESLENLYFTTRMVLEILAYGNTKLATYLMLNKMFSHKLNKVQYKNLTVEDFKNEEKLKIISENLHPLVNFTMITISFINQGVSFEKFVGVVKVYNKWLGNDNEILRKYVNQVSIKHFNKPILRENNPMGLMSMLSNFL
jgi:hypothetical protein